jgi:2-C-methyl-D-erythritol 4-phosphate cytidylyltransferase
MNIFLLMMGGSGNRVGTDIPKQFIEVNGKPIFAYIAERAMNMADIDKLVMVVPADWVAYVKEWKNKHTNTSKITHIVAGGGTRSESVLYGLKAASVYAARDDIVLIHDATHPYIDEEGTRAVIEAVKQYGGATLASFPMDTCYEMDDACMIKQVIPRQTLAIGASPEAFRFGALYDIYSTASPETLAAMSSAGAIALNNNIQMKVIPANILNLKITYQDDITLFTHLTDHYFFTQNG